MRGPHFLCVGQKGALERCFAVGLLSAIGLFAFLGCDPSAKNDPKAGEPKAPVVLWNLEKSPFVETRSFFGEVQAASNASLSAAEAGRVLKVNVLEGASVKKGDVLVELDDQLARVQLNEAVASRKETESRSAQAKIEVEKFSLMQKEQIVSELEAMRKESEAESLEAAAQGDAARVARGAELLRRHRIVAPFDGTVVSRSVDPGDWLGAGEVALQLVTSGHLEIEVRVPAPVLTALPQLKSVVVRSAERQVPARLESSVQALDPKTRTALLLVTPLEEAPWLLAGAGIYVDLSFEREGGWNIPRDALVYGVATPRVYRVEQAKASPVPVQVLATADDRALVQSDDLKEGDALVIRGNERLRPGQAVTEEGALVPPGTKQ